MESYKFEKLLFLFMYHYFDEFLFKQYLQLQLIHFESFAVGRWQPFHQKKQQPETKEEHHVSAF